MEDDMNIEFKTCYNKELIIRKSYNKEYDCNQQLINIIKILNNEN